MSTLSICKNTKKLINASKKKTIKTVRDLF